MRTRPIYCCAAGLALAILSLPVLAGYECIERNKLPDSKPLIKAFDDAMKLEPITWEWTSNWKYDVPKQSVAKTLNTCLSAIENALKTNPDNAELLLFGGITAHCAYNVDVSGTFDKAVSCLEKARAMNPADFRPDWILGVHYCQAGEIKKGMGYLLGVEKTFSSDKLPTPFWNDYASCAWLAGMRAHFMRAVDLIRSHGDDPSEGNRAVMSAAPKGYSPIDPTKVYEPKEIWSSHEAGGLVVFTANAFGFSFACPGDWEFQFSKISKASSVVTFQRGPYKGTTGNVFPHVLIVVRQEKAGDNERTFAQSMVPIGVTRSDLKTPLSVSGASIYEGHDPGLYQEEGGAHLVVAVFRRPVPAYPGLALETPLEMPSGDSKGVSYYSHEEKPGRLDGPLLYAVVLDTAESVYPLALEDWRYVLQHMVIE